MWTRVACVADGPSEGTRCWQNANASSADAAEEAAAMAARRRDAALRLTAARARVSAREAHAYLRRRRVARGEAAGFSPVPEVRSFDCQGAAGLTSVSGGCARSISTRGPLTPR